MDGEKRGWIGSSKSGCGGLRLDGGMKVWMEYKFDWKMKVWMGVCEVGRGSVWKDEEVFGGMKGLMDG